MKKLLTLVFVFALVAGVASAQEYCFSIDPAGAAAGDEVYITMYVDGEQEDLAHINVWDGGDASEDTGEDPGELGLYYTLSGDDLTSAGWHIEGPDEYGDLYWETEDVFGDFVAAGGGGDNEDCIGGGGQDGDLFTNLVMFDTDADSWTLETNIQEGDLVYTDRSATIQLLPEAYQGLEWIRTSNDSADWMGDDPIATFDVTANCTVYVAYDSREERPPCLDDWDDTGDHMENSNDGASIPYYILSQSFTAGTTVEMCKYLDDAGFYTIFGEAGAAEPADPIDSGDVAMPLGTGVNQLNVPFFLDVDAAGSSWGFVGLHNNLDTALEIGVIYFNSEGDQLRFDANVSPYNTAVIPAYASVAYRPVGDLPADLPKTIANRPQHEVAVDDDTGDLKNNGAIVIMWDDGGAGALQGRYLQVNGADSSAYLLPAGVAVAK